MRTLLAQGDYGYSGERTIWIFAGGCIVVILRSFLRFFLAALCVSVPAMAGGKSFDDYWQEALQKTHKQTESDNCVEIVTKGAIYLFTKPNNPDHPALFIRNIQYRDGKMYVVTEAHSFREGASKPSLEAWMDHPFRDVPSQK
jgi:hypothetical protein